MLFKKIPEKQLFKMSVPKFYVKKRSKNYHRNLPYWIAAQKFIRKNSWSKCSYRNASWRSVQTNYHLEWPYWNAAQKSTSKTVVQNVCTETLAEIAFKKLSLKMTVLECCLKCIRKNSRSKCPYRTASWKSVRESYFQKWQFWKARSKVYPPKQWFKMSVSKY